MHLQNRSKAFIYRNPVFHELPDRKTPVHHSYLNGNGYTFVIFSAFSASESISYSWEL